MPLVRLGPVKNKRTDFTSITNNVNEDATQSQKKSASTIIRQAMKMLEIILEKFQASPSLNSFDIDVIVFRDKNQKMTWNVTRGASKLTFSRKGCIWTLELPKISSSGIFLHKFVLL